MPVIPASLRTPMRLAGIFAGLAVAILLSTTPAKANCTASAGSANLGTVSSFAAAASSQGATASTGFTCSGSGVLTLSATNSVTATVQSATGSTSTQPRLHDPATGDYIPYSICRDSSCGQIYPIGSQISWSSSSFLGLLNTFTGPSGTLPIYLATVPGAQLAAGTYTSTITISWSWNICSVGAASICVVRDTGTATSTVDVTLVVSRDCALAAPPVDFGSSALLSGFAPVTQSISALCSKDAAYTIGIDDGLNAFNGVRRLSDGSHAIEYDIYFPASSSSRWGNSGTERRNSNSATVNPGVYTGTSSQSYSYRAEIRPGQPTPPGGTYTDTLTVDIQF